MPTGTWEDQLCHFLGRALNPRWTRYGSFLDATGLTAHTVALPQTITEQVRRVNPGTRSDDPPALAMLRHFSQAAITMCTRLAPPQVQQEIIETIEAEDIASDEKPRRLFHVLSAPEGLPEPTRTAFECAAYLLCHAQCVLQQRGIPSAPTGMLLAEWTLVYYAYLDVAGKRQVDLVVEDLLRKLRA